MYGYLSLDIIFSSLTVFLELRSGETVSILEHTKSADIYPWIFPRQIEDIIYLATPSSLKNK